MDLQLNNKVALVTGSTGICKETALTLAKEGVHLAITYLTDIDKNAAKESIKTIEKFGQKAIAVYMNVVNLKDIEKMVDIVLNEYERIDILVNCAGVCTTIFSENVTEDQWNFDIDIDLKGLFFCCKEVFNKAMKKQRSGTIINIASVVGITPVKDNPIYGIAKAGVIQLTRQLAIEWGSYNVRVNAVSPGWIATQSMLEHQDTGENADPDMVIRSIPMGRFGKPVEIANIIAFLASEKSGYTTGSNIISDGGIIAGLRLASLVDGKIEML